MWLCLPHIRGITPTKVSRIAAERRGVQLIARLAPTQSITNGGNMLRRLPRLAKALKAACPKPVAA